MSIELGPTRRSSRRGAKKRVYAVGDLVEIHDKTTDPVRVFQGRLVSKVLESSALNPRWMVSFNDEKNLLVDREAYETSFGEILGKAIIITDTATPDLTDVDATTAKNTANKKKSSRKREAVTPDAEATNSSSSSSGNEESKSKRTKTTNSVSFADNVVDNNNNKTAAARAREERSRRRQATHPEPIVVVHNSNRSNNNRKPRLDHHRSHKKKTTPPLPSHPANNHNHNHNNNNNKQDAKDVVRVPMLTGTLILYRGRHRRAEFVRNV